MHRLTPFIADEPFNVSPSRHNQRIYVDLLVTVALTEPGIQVPPPRSAALKFAIDTGSDHPRVYDSTLAWFGLPRAGPAARFVPVKSYSDSESAPMRDADLWLFSNDPHSETAPLRIELSQGILVEKDPKTWEPFWPPLVGMQTLIDAGLRIEINTQSRRFSVWIPA